MLEGNNFSQSQESVNETSEILRKYRIDKLRAPHIRALFKYFMSVPHLSDQILARYEKLADFKHVAHELKSREDISTIDDNRDRVKLLAPFWSAVATVPEMRSYLELMLDEATRSESDGVKERMRKEDFFVQELVIGGGVHGAIYNSEFAFHAPQISRLTIERRSSLGGQFRHYGPAISMNSENRPINKNVKGQLDNPNENSLGVHAPVQLTDLSARLYANNADIGLAAALDEYLSSDNALEMAVTKIRKNKDQKPGKGKYMVDLMDTETGEKYSVYTNRIIASMGLGMPDYGFLDMNENTRRICESGDFRVIRYDEFLAEVGDRSNLFPLDMFVGKRIIIIGGGHSGLTVAEYLVGLGPEYRGSIASLGSPSEIVILATKFEDDKGLLEKEIARYAALANAVKAKSNGEEGERIKLLRPLPGLHAVCLEEKIEAGGEKSLTVLCKDKRKEGEDIEKLDADIVITTAGFTDTYGEIFDELLGESAREKFADNFTDVTPPDSPEVIAKCLKDYSDIIFVGPAAQMVSKESQGKHSRIYHRPTNAVAIPNTAENTTNLARYMATEDQKEKKKNAISRTKITEKIVKLPPTEYQQESWPLNFTFELSEGAKNRKFDPEIHYDALLELCLLAHAEKYKAPKPIDLSFSVKATEGNTIEIESDQALPPSYEEVIRTLSNNELFQAAIARLLTGRSRKERSVSLVCRLK